MKTPPLTLLLQITTLIFFLSFEYHITTANVNQQLIRNKEGLSFDLEKPSLRYVDYQTLSSNINQQNNFTILGADNFLTLFLWKDLEIRSVQDFNKTQAQNLRLFTYTREFTLPFLSGLFHSTIPFVYNLTNVNFKWNFKQILMNGNTDCLMPSVFERYDGMVDTPFLFAQRIRLSRIHRGYRKKKLDETSSFLNPNDFHAIPIMPLNFWTVYKDEISTNDNSSLNSWLVHNLAFSLIQNSTISTLGCKDSLTHDVRVLSRLNGIMNTTEKQLLIFEKTFSNNSKLISYNLSYYEKAVNKWNQIIYNDSITWNLNQVESNLFPSSCHFCETASCIGERWNSFDYLDFSVVIVGMFHYLILFFSGSFASPVMKRRLGIGYLAPFLTMCLYTSTTNAFNGGCITLAAMGTVFSASSLIFLYILTTVRFYYMRNLYKIIKLTKFTKFHRVIGSVWFGLPFTIVTPFLISFILILPHIPLFETYEAISWNLYTNLLLIILTATSCLMGLTCIIYDIYANRKGIKEKGFQRFFFFEDPFYLRIDMLSLSVIVILIIGLAISNTVANSAVPIFRFLIGLCIYMICGGSAMIIIFIHKVSYRKPSLPSQEDDFMKTMLETNDRSFYNLFKEYCEKEWSLENILFFDKLSELSKLEEPITNEMLKQLDVEFIMPLSRYEVNLPNTARNEFYKIMEKKEPITFKDLTPIYLETLNNLRDTYQRFDKTREFKDWTLIYILQKEQGIL